MASNLGQIIGKFNNYLTNENGDILLSFVISGDSKHAAKQTVAAIRTAAKEGKERLKIDIDIERKKRSLNANAYMWILCEKISEVLKVNKAEIYQRFIKEQGVCKTLEISENAADTFIKGWGMNGTGWIAEKVDFSHVPGFSVINAYYGSSVYNAKQMARLIDAIVTECKELEIETMPPQELEALVGKWKGDKV